MPWRCLIVFIEDRPTNPPPHHHHHQTLHLTHILEPRSDDIVREAWGRKKKVRRKEEKERGAFQINSCRRFCSEHNKCPCHLGRSQIASHRFVAPKKAQNAHGGEYDCRPSLKIQSCLCSAMKKRSAPLSLFLLQAPAGLGFINAASRLQKTMQEYSRHPSLKSKSTHVLPPTERGRLTCTFQRKCLTITPFKTHLLPFLCAEQWLASCTCAVSSAITKWPHFFLSRTKCPSWLCDASLFICVCEPAEWLFFFLSLSGVGVSPPLATQNTTAAIPSRTLGPPQYASACSHVHTSVLGNIHCDKTPL